MTNERLMDTLRRLLALADRDVSHTTEAEAASAAAKIAELLAKHNLSMADLEQRGQKTPGVREEAHDLGKAAFKWKLQLAEAVAEHFFCLPLIDHSKKTVAFVGRPENVEALQMLYGWLIDQIRRLATDERRKYLYRTGEHIDPLRWQISFGEGAVNRLRTRLEEQRRRQQESDPNAMALVLHHESEISDYLEETYGYRRDGQQTRQQREATARYEQRMAEMRELLEHDPDAYYMRYPWDRPETPEQLSVRKQRQEKEMNEWRKREERNARRRTGPAYREQRWTAEDERRDQQQSSARQSGHKAADRVNLSPFLKNGSTGTNPQIGG